MNFAAINEADREPARKQIRALCQQGLYEEAAALAAAASDETLIFTSCEAIADHICKKNPKAAARFYAIAAQMWTYEGTQATGSGEGIMAMDHLEEIEKKIAALPAPKPR